MGFVAKVVRQEGPGATQLRAILANLKDAAVKVGFFEDAQYEDGTPVAYVAVWIEFGTKTSPPRPVFRVAVKEHLGEWRELVRLLSKKVATGQLTMLQVLDQLGAAATGHLSKAIAGLKEPALAESTIKNRMNRKANKDFRGNLDKPLIDSGLFFASPSWQVEKGKQS